MILLSAGTVSAAPGIGDKLSISVTNKFGDIFTNLTVAQILPDGLLLEHKAGQVKVKFENLPANVREAYQPLSALAAKKQVEESAANSAFAVREKQLQADQTKIREQKDQRMADAVKEIAIEVPGQGWKIIILNPDLVEAERKTSTNMVEFSYKAANKDGFFVGIMVMKPAQSGMTDEDVFNYWWPQMSRLPEIDKNSVKAERGDHFIRVSYTAQGVPNVNFYSAFRGKWVDVHIGKSPYGETDAKLFNEFDAHLVLY
jgi:hypothetical protein